MPDKSLAPLYDAENALKEEAGERSSLPLRFRLALGTWGVRHMRWPSLWAQRLTHSSLLNA